jgi:hypothetical protein
MLESLGDWAPGAEDPIPDRPQPAKTTVHDRQTRERSVVGAADRHGFAAAQQSTRGSGSHQRVLGVLSRINMGLREDKEHLGRAAS